MNDLRSRIIDEHIKENYPDAKIVSYDDPDSGLLFHTADQLAAVEDDWFPLCSYKDPDTGKVIYGGRSRIYHTYTEGETGIGKTTRFVMQSVRALSSMKNKPSFLIVDIHGEIIENLYEHLTANGYDIRILNCDDPARSDTYNPFSESVKSCLAEGHLTDQALSCIRRISEVIHPSESHNDPIWEKGACAYTYGIILDKFESLLAGDLVPECITVHNVIRTHYKLRELLGKQIGNKNLFKIPYFDKKGMSALSVQKMLGVTNNADRTQASYFGVVENHYDPYANPIFYKLSSSSTIDIDSFIEKPTVIVIQSGDTKIGDNLISLLVNDIYTKAVKVGKKSATKRLPRNIQCFLDEFANCNIASKDEFTKMLTTSRKFGMYWHMLLQCDAQLERKFDRDTGTIIRSNCTEIFMGSNDYDTLVRFASSCGRKTVESLASSLSGQLPVLETVNLMVPDKLRLTEEGFAYVKSDKHHIMRTYFEAFYNCPEFTRPDDIDMIYPHNDFDYEATYLDFELISRPLSEREYEVLAFIRKQWDGLFYPCTETISNEFPEYNIIGILSFLQKKGYLKISDQGNCTPGEDPALYALVDYRAKLGIYGAENSVEDEPEPHKPPMSNPFDV